MDSLSIRSSAPVAPPLADVPPPYVRERSPGPLSLNHKARLDKYENPATGNHAEGAVHPHFAPPHNAVESLLTLDVHHQPSTEMVDQARAWRRDNVRLIRKNERAGARHALAGHPRKARWVRRGADAGMLAGVAGCIATVNLLLGVGLLYEKIRDTQAIASFSPAHVLEYDVCQHLKEVHTAIARATSELETAVFARQITVAEAKQQGSRLRTSWDRVRGKLTGFGAKEVRNSAPVAQMWWDTERALAKLEKAVKALA